MIQFYKGFNMAYNSLSVQGDNLTYDVRVENGQLVRAYDSEAVRENVRQRLLTVYQEWFLDLTEGLPWFTELTGRNVSLDRIKSAVARTIASTKYVEELISIDVSYDKTIRKLLIQFEYRDSFNQLIREEL